MPPLALNGIVVTPHSYVLYLFYLLMLYYQTNAIHMALSFKFKTQLEAIGIH